MSLATRCTSCKTVFRVVQDQLKVSEGWVRCGRCGTVFNALEALFDLDREREPAPPPPASAPPASSIDPKKDKGKSTPHRGKSKREASRKKSSEPPTPANRRRSDQPSSFESTTKSGYTDFADAQFAPEAEGAGKPKAPQRQLDPSSYEVDETIIAGTESPGEGVGDDYQPATLEFVRLAERKAKWADPRIQRIVGSAIAVLGLTLFLQVGHHFRDIAAAHWPETAPLLVRWCQVLNCTLQAPRHIDSVVVESITMTRNNNSSDTFLLSVVLQNRAAFAVAMPSLDLSLRDTNGALITRRMLKPEDLQLKTQAIEPRSETQVQVLLTEKDQHIVNYTVEAFYP